MEHLSTPQLEGYRRRSLSPAELAGVAAHLAECQPCRRRAGGEEALADACSAWRALLEAEVSAHLDYAELEALVDGGLDDAARAAAGEHLEECGECGTVAAELTELRRRLQASALLRDRPGSNLGTGAPPPAPIRAWSLPGVLGAAAAAAAVATGAVWIALRPDVRDVQERLSRLEGAHARLASAPAAATRPAAILTDGGTTVARGAGGEVLGLPDMPPSLDQQVREALSHGRLPLPARAAALAAVPEQLMGAAEQGVPFALLEPLGTVVEADRPLFRWRRLAGAESYVVAVYDTRLRRLTQSPSLRATEWSPPRPLPRGEVLSWQVTALRDGEEVVSPSAPAPAARFEVLAASAADELRRARAAYSEWHLVMAVVYSRAGLRAEAQREIRALQAANPGSPLAGRLAAGLWPVR